MRVYTAQQRAVPALWPRNDTLGTKRWHTRDGV